MPSSPSLVLPQIVGHRGAAGEAPENTIAGLRHAIAVGVRHVEIDLRLSADAQLMVIHDHDLKRTTGRKGHVAKLDASTLQTFNALESVPAAADGSSKASVPTLEALLAATTELESYQLEIKSDKYTDNHALIIALRNFFPNAKSAEKVIITSFDTDLISELRHQYPYLKTGVIAKKNLDTAISHAIEFNCHHLCLHYALALNNIEKIQQSLAVNPLHLSVWTVNETELIAPLMQIPVHSIITDVPSSLLQAMQTLN